jgi:hypothetical protein
MIHGQQNIKFADVLLGKLERDRLKDVGVVK